MAHWVWSDNGWFNVLNAKAPFPAFDFAGGVGRFRAEVAPGRELILLPGAVLQTIEHRRRGADDPIAREAVS